ncbi:Chondramide synthase cmdD [Planctomycetes bacterium Poly30]|uniref:Chondramide synthase cmdD n=1 Tax=Saltatorellus ferox TaxID=2528018 RepID=A0A518EZM2_9BACT|nr:Chondramide synthase cmdD [Planctomycetes bacterium Poly30]
MRWRPLTEFRDERIGKIARLRTAVRRGILVPPTVWARAASLQAVTADQVSPPSAFGPPWIVRSAAPDEDGAEGTAAGRYESVEVMEPGAFQAAVSTVADSMRDALGEGASVFVQPLLRPEAGGVAFFDGFFYERSESPGGNRAITAGEARGDVERADLVRGEPWSNWLRRVGAAFEADTREGGAALDIEYVRTGDSYTLLQARPARFSVRRNPILSLANHREILGDHPSPWVTSALVQAGRGALEEFARIDPEIQRWNGQYAEACAGRAWLSFSFFFRLMDHWGLPRTFVTDGVGGESGGPEDARPLLGRMLRKSPRLIRLQLQNRRTIRRIPEALAGFDERLKSARTLPEWFDATAFGLDLALRTNFAINGAWTGIARVRGALRIRGRARVVTEEMMAAYEGLAEEEPQQREGALDAWLRRFGHRGPLESDPMQPRFRELRDVLLADLLSRERVDAAPSLPEAKTGFLFRIDQIREQFRDDLMRRWETLRTGVLGAAEEAVRAGLLESASDAFLLDGASMKTPELWREAVREARERRIVEARFDPPLTARRDAIEEAERLATEGSEVDAGAAPPELRGIGVGTGIVRGRVHRASDLTSFLGWLSAHPRAEHPVILVVPALEPSWSVVFGRIAGAITEIGGELSHASILLRESGTPAIVNCHHASRTLEDGDEVELDANSGRVRRIGGSHLGPSGAKSEHPSRAPLT